MLIALAALSLVMAIFAPVLVPIVAPGFDAPTTELTIRMTRIMLLSPVLIGMGAVVTGILNTYGQFTVPAIAPLLYNLAIIAAAIFLTPVMGVEASRSASRSGRWRTCRSSSQTSPAWGRATT